MLEKLLEICKHKSNLYIQTHDFPDPDAISAGFALHTLLKLNGIDAKLVYVGKIDRVSTERMVSLFNIPIFPFSGDYAADDQVICIDTQKNMGNVLQKGGNVFACIDHHPTKTKEEYEYMQVNLLGACATVMALEYMELGAEMPQDVATALLYGLKMDTLQFSRGVKDEDITVFSYLLKRADPEKLRFLETSNLIMNDLRAFGVAIENIKVISDIGLSYVPFDCPDGLVSALSDFMLSIDELSVAIVFSQRAQGIKLSVRSILPYVDAGTMTRLALEGIGSGGGHPSFAGGYIPLANMQGTQDQWFDELKTRFMKAYHEVMVN